MIPIDQLLESVDLEFEPRWVTKDKDNSITLFEQKPERDIEFYEWDDYVGRTKTLGPLKLAEFADKDWQECIYEVPRKTTGKIERFILDDFVTVEGVNHSLSCVLDSKAISKLNALVDAVNKHADIIRQIGQWGSSKGEFLWCETLTKFEPDELKGAKND